MVEYGYFFLFIRFIKNEKHLLLFACMSVCLHACECPVSAVTEEGVPVPRITDGCELPCLCCLPFVKVKSLILPRFYFQWLLVGLGLGKTYHKCMSRCFIPVRRKLYLNSYKYANVPGFLGDTGCVDINMQNSYQCMLFFLQLPIA